MNKSLHFNLNKSVRLLFQLLAVMLLQQFSAFAQLDPVDSHFSDKNVKLFDKHFYNLSAFQKLKQTPVGMEALKLIDPAYLEHPDLGVSVHPLHTDAIELVDERTEYSSTYLMADGTTIFSSASAPINYIDENGWFREIKYTLDEKPIVNDIFRAGNQPIPKSINAISGKTTFETAIGNIAHNQQTTLKFIDFAGKEQSTGLQNKKHSVGENGLFINEAFPGIDMQVVLMKNGAVKTNYIVKDKSGIDANSEYVVIEDYLTVPMGVNIDFDPNIGIHNGIGNDWEGSLVFRNDIGEDVFHYMSPMIYDKSYARSMMNSVLPSYSDVSSAIEDPGVESTAYTYGAYRITKISDTQYKVAVVIKTSWLLDAEREFPVVIDPVTYTGNSLTLGSGHCARRVSGTTPSDNPGPTGVGCYSTTTVLPAGYMLVSSLPVRAYSGYATRGCAASSTWMKYYGPCGMYPRESGFFFFCNTTLANVDCGAPPGGHSLDGILSRCMTSAGEDCAAATAPSCSNQTITFNVCTQSRCFSEAAGTCVRTSTTNATNYVEGLGFFRIDILAEKITHTLAGGGTVCPSTVNNLTLTARFGVPNALNTSNCNDNMGGTYSWSATATGGTLSAASGTTNTSGVATPTWTAPAAAGTYTVTTTVCNTACSTPAATMCDSKSVSFTVGNSIAPVVSDMVVCNGVNAVPAITNTQGGYTYTWENGIDGAGAVIGTGTSRTIAAVNNSTVNYSVRATSPCTSNWENFTITWGPVQPPSTTDVAACPGTSATLTASCGTDCEWYTASSGGASFNSTGSYTVNPVTTSVTYYVEYNAGAGCVSARTPVSVSTNALNVTTNPTSFNPICTGTAAFSSSVTGHSTNASRSVVTAGPNTIADNSTCTGPDCTDANSGMLTLATPSGVTSPLVASSIQEVCFTTNAAICGKEAQFFLISPAGTVLTLFSGRNKASVAQTNGTQICFTASATAAIYAPTMGAGVTIPAGDYIPDGGALGSAFVGEAAAAGSTWTLHVVDNVAGGCGSGTGTVSNFTMVFGVTGSPTYSWAGGPAGGSLSSSTVSGPTFTPPAATIFNNNYTLTVTDVNGCTGTATVNVVCPNVVLPIELVSFYGDVGDVDAGDRSHYLKWKTESETNLNYFDLERSQDGTEFSQLGRVMAVGQSSTIQQYNFTDYNPYEGINFYRLKMVDLNGEYEYSDVLTMNGTASVNMYLVPNPTSKSLEIIYHSRSKSESVIEIMDSKGAIIHRLKNDCVKGQNSVSLDVEEYFKGVYTVHINVNGEILTNKFIKL